MKIKQNKFKLLNFQKSISTKVLLTFLSLTMIVFVTTGVIINNYNSKLLHKNINKALTSDTTIITQEIDAYFSERGVVINQLANNQQIIDYFNEVRTREQIKTHPDYKNVLATLKNTIKGDNNLTTVYLALNDASYLFTNTEWDCPPDWNLQSRQWYLDTVSKGDLFYSAPYKDAVTGKMVVAIAKPIFDKNGQPLGAVSLDLSIEKIPSIMEGFKIGKTGYPILVNNEGVTMYNPDKSKILKENITEFEGELGELGKKMVNGESNITKNKLDNKEIYIAYAPIKSNGWSVAAIIPKSEIEEQLMQFNKTLVTIYLIALFMLFIILLFITKKILKDIPKLLFGIKKIADGDLTVRTNIKSKDEIGQIADAINAMADSLQNIVKNISTNSQDVTSSGEELSAILQEINEQIQNINSGSQEIAASMQQTSASTEEMTASGLEMSNTINTLKENAHNGSLAVKEIENRALQMKTDSEKAKHTALTLYKEKQTSILKAIEAGKIVDEINNMAEIIANIANQTNLLALNASIEAARAGEHGKGFAVVAAEVGKLADQSTETVTNIQEIVNQVKSAFSNLSENTDGILKFMDENVTSDYEKMIHRAELSLNDSENVAKLVNDFSQNVSGISSSIENLTKAITSVSSIVEEVAASASEIAGNINQTTESANSVGEVAENQAQLAQNLNNIVNQFKL